MKENSGNKKLEIQETQGLSLMVRCPKSGELVEMRRRCFGCRRFRGINFEESGVILCREVPR